MNPLKILMVEDKKIWAESFIKCIQKPLVDRLENTNWDSLDIHYATNQKEADEAVLKKNGVGFDLVLLDLVYPECGSVIPEGGSEIDFDHLQYARLDGFRRPGTYLNEKHNYQ